jgi:hypothetical protein
LVKAANANGIHSDNFKKAGTEFGYQNAGDYLLATAHAAAGIVREPNLVNDSQQIVTEVMGTPGYSHAQKMTVLRDAADRMWKRLNLPAIASVYYKLRDRANLN